MTIDDNPFERWGLDPRDDPKKLTRRMRRESRKLDADERQQLQRDWRILTSDDVARARWALLTHPRVADTDSPWSEADKLASSVDEPALDALEPTVNDGLVLPLMADELVDADPPFLPRPLIEGPSLDAESSEDE